MSQPDVKDVHTNRPLTMMSIAHMNKLQDYGADKVAPLVFVPNQTDIIPLYSRGYFFADEGNALLRSPGERARVSGFALDVTNTYKTLNWAIGFEIPNELRANADQVWQLDRSVIEFLTQLSLIRRERLMAAAAMVTGVWGSSVSGTTNFTKWSDYGASDPIGDIETALDTIGDRVGGRGNCINMGQIVWRKLKHHPDFIDRIKGGATAANPALVTPNLLAQALEIDKVIVSRARYRSSAEGASLTLAAITDDDLLVTYSPDNVGLMDPAAIKTFVWESMTAGKQSPQYMRQGRNDREQYDWLEVHQHIVHKITEAQAGYIFLDAVD